MAPPANGAGGGATDNGWTDERERGGRTPPAPSAAGNGRDYRRSSRSRSPGAGGARRDDDRGRNGEAGANPGNNLHVSGLSTKVDNRDLEAAFGKYGKVAKASVMYDPHSRESRGFGFVTMETAADAEACIANLNATDLKGRTMTVEKARRGRARTPTPGRYFGPPKRMDGTSDYERPYDPRPYDSRYSERGMGRYDDRRGGYDDRYPPPSRYGGGGGRGGYDDRRYDDRGSGRDYRDYDRSHAPRRAD